jgi:hypothetical protein
MMSEDKARHGGTAKVLPPLEYLKLNFLGDLGWQTRQQLECALFRLSSLSISLGSPHVPPLALFEHLLRLLLSSLANPLGSGTFAEVVFNLRGTYSFRALRVCSGADGTRSGRSEPAIQDQGNASLLSALSCAPACAASRAPQFGWHIALVEGRK